MKKGGIHDDPVIPIRNIYPRDIPAQLHKEA